MQPPASTKVDGCDWAAHLDHGRETHADASLDGIRGLHSGCEIVNTKVASNASVTALREQLEQDLYRFRAVHLCIEGRGLFGKSFFLCFLFFSFFFKKKSIFVCFGCGAFVSQARC